MHRWDPNGTTTPGQSGSGCNGNQRALHTPQGSKTGVLQSDVVLCYTQDINFFVKKI